jgi:preprotein translocase subunit SecF
METKKSWYDRTYILFLVIPLILLLISLIYLGFFFSQHKDFMLKDVSLSGGTSITLNGEINVDKLEQDLNKLPDISVRKLTDLNSGKLMAVIIETSLSPEEIQPIIESSLGYPLNSENSSIEFSGPILSQSFYLELLKIILLAFTLMGLVIFLIFGESNSIKAISIGLSLAAVKLTFPARTILVILAVIIGLAALAYSSYNILKKSGHRRNKIYLAISITMFVLALIFNIYYLIFIIVFILFLTYLIESPPSIAVIFAAFADIVMALTIVDFLGIKLSAAGIAAFLMLIGYSVDTDILLTTRALKKREGTLNQRIYGAFKTGILMTLTGLVAVLPAFFIVTGLPDSFRQIFLILALGLGADIINTWMANASIIKLYCNKKGIK